MSPTFFSLGIISFVITWAITATGLPSYFWISYIVPFFSVFFFCDHQKLWKEMWSIAGLTIFVPALPFLYVDYDNLKIVTPLVCIRLLIGAFSWEKMLFIGDECGELAKFACLRIAVIVFPFPLNKMNWKGDWVYCSPYSRGPIRRNIEFYYRLVGKESKSPTSVNSYDLNRVNFNFPIEKCNVVCKYFAAGSNTRTFGLNNTNVAQVPSMREEPLVATACKDDQGASTSQSQHETIALTEGSSLQDEIVEHHVKNQRPVNKFDAALSVLSTDVSGDEELDKDDQGSSSFKSQLETIALTEGSPPQDEIVLEHHVQNQRPVNKVEAALSSLSTDGSGFEEIDSFTFFSDDAGRVAEIGRAMMVLKEHQNLIFSRFHRNIGSRHPQAHATCYQFKEIFELILSKGYTLEKVSLSKNHTCAISGTTEAVFLDIINLAVIVWLNYLQLESSTSHSSLVAVIFMFAFFQLLSILLKFLVKCRKKCLYTVISTIFRPDWTDNIYLFIQRKCPSLAFCNQSYGCPYAQDLGVVCKFLDNGHINGVYDREEAFPPLNGFARGWVSYDLRHVELELEISGGLGDYSVNIFFKLKGDEKFLYNNCFKVEDSRKISNLVGMLIWLKDNQWQGICKSWQKESLMHAFTYEELVCKTLNKDRYEDPRLFFLRKKKKISVEAED